MPTSFSPCWRLRPTRPPAAEGRSFVETGADRPCVRGRSAGRLHPVGGPPSRSPVASVALARPRRRRISLRGATVEQLDVQRQVVERAVDVVRHAAQARAQIAPRLFAGRCVGSLFALVHDRRLVPVRRSCRQRRPTGVEHPGSADGIRAVPEPTRARRRFALAARGIGLALSSRDGSGCRATRHADQFARPSCPPSPAPSVPPNRGAAPRPGSCWGRSPPSLSISPGVCCSRSSR
jgi:hypothetical protein